MADLTAEDRQLFEKLGENKVRAEVARGGAAAFGGHADKREAATEWLAACEHQRTLARATPAKPTMIGPVMFVILVVALFIFVAAL